MNECSICYNLFSKYKPKHLRKIKQSCKGKRFEVDFVIITHNIIELPLLAHVISHITFKNRLKYCFYTLHTDIRHHYSINLSKNSVFYVLLSNITNCMDLDTLV